MNDAKKKNTQRLPVHPIADLFPVMSDEELAELAEDIKQNGLLHPIVVAVVPGKVINSDGPEVKVVVDGRNRLMACEMAGIEPRFSELEAQDPRVFILSTNVRRRHLSKGQRAMAVAMVYSKAEKGGRGKKSAAKNLAETAEFSDRRLQQARQILSHSRALAQSVLSGVTSLDTALKQVRHKTRQVKFVEAKPAKLRKERFDRADRGNAGPLTSNKAISAYEEAKKDLQRRTQIFQRCIELLAPTDITDAVGQAEHVFKQLDFELLGRNEISNERVHLALRVLRRIAERMGRDAGACKPSGMNTSKREAARQSVLFAMDTSTDNRST